MAETSVDRDLAALAPRFRAAVEAALAECRAAGLDAIVYEARRSNERQEWLYAQGRTRPGERVTNAKDAMHGWHFFGLAVDVISRSMEWDAPADWWQRMGAIFERHGCDWGGRWTTPDLPHVQWGTLKPSPSDRARELYVTDGLGAVWREVGALEEPAPVPQVVPGVPAVVPTIVPGLAEVPRPPLVTVPPNLTPVPVPDAPSPRDWSDPEPSPSLWERLTHPLRSIDPMRTIISRIAAAIVAVLLTFVAGTLGVDVSPAIHDSLVEGVTLLGLGVWGILYAVLHKLIDHKINPTDVAKHPGPISDGPMPSA
jgi:peptidoglycan L-alanyl-D-glutamate endopeptidase CwlK